MSELVPSSKPPLGDNYALALFEETVGRVGPNATIKEAEADITFRKHNVLIDVAGLSLSARRCLNVMNYLAFSAPVEVLEFDFDLGLFMFLINSESRNRRHLLDALREAQKSSVLLAREKLGRNNTSEMEYVSIPLVGRVGIAGGRVYFKFDEAIRKLHKDPRGYTLLSMRTTASLDSVHAHALYEKLKSMAYRGSPTEWFTVDEVRRWLDLHDAKYVAEFKAFNRRILDKVRTKINDITDLHIEIETRSSPGSKRITHLRFHFREQEGKLVQSLAQTEVRKTLYDTLRGEFGLGNDDLQAITLNASEYTPSRIQSAIEFVRHRMSGRGPKVRFPGRLFIKALKEGWTVPSAELVADGKPAEPAAPARPAAPAATAAAAADTGLPTAEDPATAALRREYERSGELGFETYLGYGAPQQAEFWAAFARSSQFRVLKAQLQLAKEQPSAQALKGNDRLRWAFGQHVMTALKKAARKERAGHAEQSALFGG
jgi:plasmid replication initiation protein